MGETVETTGKAVTVSVDLEMPEWINVDAIDVYMNVEGIDTTPAMTNSDPLAPTQSIPVTWDAQDIEVAAQGNVLHKRRKKTVTFDLTTTKDAYVVLLVRGNSASMFPILNRAVVPMAFSNPIFLDADGWSVRTLDAAPAAHVENTVAVTASGARVLTNFSRPESPRHAASSMSSAL